MDWLHALIGPDNGEATPWQLGVRALILFFCGLAFLRIAGRRTFSEMTPLDIIVVLIVGSNLSRAMTGRAQFAGSLLATFVVVALHRLLVFAAIRWPGAFSWLKAKPVVLLRDGEPDRAAMRRHGISEGDLAEGLRLEQIANPEEAELVVLEAGGTLSVVPKRR